MHDYILIVLLLLNLVFSGYLLTKTRKLNYKDREERIFKLYQNIEEMMDDFESYVLDAQKEIEAERSKSFQPISQENIQASENLQDPAGIKEVPTAVENNETDVPRKPLADKSQQPDSKVNEVINLYNKGLSKEQIAKELKISRTEVQLILNI